MGGRFKSGGIKEPGQKGKKETLKIKGFSFVASETRVKPVFSGEEIKNEILTQVAPRGRTYI